MLKIQSFQFLLARHLESTHFHHRSTQNEDFFLKIKNYDVNKTDNEEKSYYHN